MLMTATFVPFFMFEPELQMTDPNFVPHSKELSSAKRKRRLRRMHAVAAKPRRTLGLQLQ